MANPIALAADHGGFELKEAVKAHLEELRSIYQGVYLIRDLSPKTQAAIVSYGERISSRIAAALIRGAEWFDSREFIKTERKAGRNMLATDLTNRLVKENWQTIPQRPNRWLPSLRSCLIDYMNHIRPQIFIISVLLTVI